MATGAVTGLAAEAEIARQAGLVAAAGAGTPEGTERAIRILIEQGVPGLVSFGIAGGLAPNLLSGTLIAPAAVRATDGEAHWVDVEWHARLTRMAHAAGIPLVVGGIVGAETSSAAGGHARDRSRSREPPSRYRRGACAHTVLGVSCNRRRCRSRPAAGGSGAALQVRAGQRAGLGLAYGKAGANSRIVETRA
jgi:hypothetical protein